MSQAYATPIAPQSGAAIPQLLSDTVSPAKTLLQANLNDAIELSRGWLSQCDGRDA
jgi:hypothetical protein